MTEAKPAFETMCFLHQIEMVDNVQYMCIFGNKIVSQNFRNNILTACNHSDKPKQNLVLDPDTCSQPAVSRKYRAQEEISAPSTS
jgi:hypothetical protein